MQRRLYCKREKCISNNNKDDKKCYLIANVDFHKIGITNDVQNILNLAVRVISFSCERETILSL